MVTGPTGTTSNRNENILIIFPLWGFTKQKNVKLINRLSIGLSHIKIKAFSASSPESEDFLPVALSLSGFGGWSLDLKGPWSSVFVPRALGRWTESDTEAALTERKRR